MQAIAGCAQPSRTATLFTKPRRVNKVLGETVCHFTALVKRLVDGVSGRLGTGGLTFTVTLA